MRGQAITRGGVMGAFEIYRARRGEYRFRYRANTGEIVATSTAYPTKAEARRAMAAVFGAAEGSTNAGRPRRRHRRHRWGWTLGGKEAGPTRR